MTHDFKPILCVDFDGVIHSYTSGWKGADVATDPPVKGAAAALSVYTERFTVMVYSSRSSQPHGVACMRRYVYELFEAEYGHARAYKLIERIEFPRSKPPAFLSLDDRAIRFEGVWPDVHELADFVPWNKR